MWVHFIGIGGIGVSALAQYYLAKGGKVSGSDLVSSEIIEFLEKKGAKIFIGKHRAGNLSQSIDMVVYSPAVQKDNPEIKKASVLGIKSLSYPEALGELTKEHFTIAVSGTHGKSTTAAMLALILTKAGLDPTVIIGTKLKEFGGTNFRQGESKYLIIEADEWQASFLNYWPKIIVLTNIEAEHLDYYKDLKDILKTYQKYISRLPKDGILIANKDDENIKKIFNFQHPKGVVQKSAIADFWTTPLIGKFSIKEFSIKQKEAKVLKKNLKVPGQHNIYNSLAALTAARALKIPDKVSLEALSEYRGCWRRFEEKEIKIGDKKIILVSDYGHHPTEVGATLEAARGKFPGRKIWLVFQPHQYQRTFYFFDDFVRVFGKALGRSLIDRLIITDIYDVAGREKKEIKKRVSIQEMVSRLKSKKSFYLAKGKIKDHLEDNLEGGEAVIIMGAGDIYELIEELST